MMMVPLISPFSLAVLCTHPLFFLQMHAAMAPPMQSNKQLKLSFLSSVVVGCRAWLRRSRLLARLLAVVQNHGNKTHFGHRDNTSKTTKQSTKLIVRERERKKDESNSASSSSTTFFLLFFSFFATANSC